MKHRHFLITALCGLIFLLLYSTLGFPAAFEVVDDLWVTDRTGVGTTAPYGLLQVGTLPTTPGLIVTTGNNVGIGTTAPGAALEVAGQVKITGGTPGANKVLTSDANGLGSWENFPTGVLWTDDGAVVRLTTDTNNVGIGLTNAGAKLHLSGAGTGTGFAFRIADTTPTDRLVVQDDGNLGLGTTAPKALLQVGTSPTPGLVVTAAGNVGIGDTIANALLQVGTWPTPGLVVTADGNVGVGTTAPSVTLEVMGDTILQTTSNTTTTFIVEDSAGTNILVGNASTNSLTTGGTFTAGGSIYSINGSKDDGSFSFNNDGNTGMYCGATCGNNRLQFSTGGRDRLRIDSNGNVGIGITLPVGILHIYGAGTTASFALRIADSLSTDRLVVQDIGNVGIGTTVPYGLLQVGTLPTAPGLIVTTGNNVGIGTTNPKAKLEIIPANTSSGFYLNLAEAKLIMKSPDGTCSACGPNNSDAWSCANVACP